jgi:hypothetical protein
VLKGTEWRWIKMFALSKIFEGAVPVKSLSTLNVRAAFVCVCVEYCACRRRSKIFEGQYPYGV